MMISALTPPVEMLAALVAAVNRALESGPILAELSGDSALADLSDLTYQLAQSLDLTPGGAAALTRAGASPLW